MGAMPASYMRFLADNFLDFLSEDKGAKDAGLTYALDEWVSNGDAIELTGGDFEIFLQAVIYIMMRVIRPGDYSSLPAIEIDIDIDFGEGVPPDVLDRRLWKAKVFQHRRTD